MTNETRKPRVLLIATALVVVFLCACAAVPPQVPYTPPAEPAPPTTQPPPPNGERWIFGASISWMVAGYAQGDGRIWDLNPARGLEDIRPKVDSELAERPTWVALADISTNSAGTWDGRDGWTGDDEWYWWTTLTHVQQGTCVTLVLPHLTEAAEARNPGVLAEVEQARTWLVRAQVEATWINVNVADWRVWSGPHIGDDGIHVNAGPEAADAWVGMLADAEHRCGT